MKKSTLFIPSAFVLRIVPASIRTSDTRIIRYSYAAILIESDGRHFSGASRTVPVISIIARHRIIIVIVYIGTRQRILPKLPALIRKRPTYNRKLIRRGKFLRNYKRDRDDWFERRRPRSTRRLLCRCILSARLAQRSYRNRLWRLRSVYNTYNKIELIN